MLGCNTLKESVQAMSAQLDDFIKWTENYSSLETPYALFQLLLSNSNHHYNF